MRLGINLVLCFLWTAIFVGWSTSSTAATAESINPAEGRRMLEQAMNLPKGRALIAIYAPPIKGGWGFFKQKKYRSIRPETSGLFPVMAEQHLFYGKDHPATQVPQFISVLPGRYILTAKRRNPTITQTIEVEIAAGERRLYKWPNDDGKPLLVPVSPAMARSDKELLSQKVQVIPLDEEQLRQHNRYLLDPEESNIVPGSDCLPDPVKLRWSNARFEGKVRDCRHIKEGTFTYDDGHRVTLRFTEQAEMGKIGARFSIQNDRYILHAAPYHPLYWAQVNSPERWYYRNQRHSGNGNELVAIDGVRLAQVRPDEHQLVDMLTGKHGSTVTLTFNTALSEPIKKLVVTRSNKLFTGLNGWNIASQIEYPDGRRYTGPTTLAAVEEGKMPLVRPLDSASSELEEKNLHGQMVYPDGTGIIGQFEKGLPKGQAFFFKGDQGEPRFYELDASGKNSRLVHSGEELKGSAYSNRSASDILLDFDNLPKSAVIDLLRKRWVDALLAEKWTAYLTHMAELQTLGFDTGVESIYYEARALQAEYRYELAYDKLQSYLNLAGSEGANYAAALDLFTQLQGPAQQARQRRLAKIEEARKNLIRFCQKFIDAEGVLLCGGRQFIDQLEGADALECKK